MPDRHEGRFREARLDDLREEARRSGRVEAAGLRAAGGPVPPPAPVGYHGRPILKPPVWTWEVPLYFFIGGTAGMAAVLAAAAARLPGGAGAVRAGLWLAVVGAAASGALLVSDLGRPARFLNMLRLFKWRSPMSVGAWVLAAFSVCCTLDLLAVEARAREAVASPPGAVLSVGLAAGAVLGALLATYTGVLLGATAIPAWHVHRRLLPLHFGVAGLGSAAAALRLIGLHGHGFVLLGVWTATIETGIAAWVELRRHGAADRALRAGRSGLLLRAGGVLSGPLSLVLWFAAPAAGAVTFLLGALASRYGWVAAGRACALDPRAVLEPSYRPGRRGNR